MDVFARVESEVRSYCRSFPAVFDRGEGCHLYDENGRRYLDFFAGAGVLSYGHNHPKLKAALLDYVARDGVVHGLDMKTTAKRRFLQRFEELVLAPRGLRYRVQFPGPTGTNAVEAALKLARKVTGRQRILAFTNSFHGMTLGALAVTGNGFKRAGAGVPLTLSIPMPFAGYLGDQNTIDYVDRFLADSGSGVELPAAIILETIQAEGGVNVASDDWLRRIADLAKRHDILLIVDDVQVGCGRTGPFFSFERAGIEPDIVCLSKALSGYGLPFAIVLMKPEYDAWQPGEHNGTFRGNNLAFVTAATALDLFWQTDELTRETVAKGELVADRLREIAARIPELRGTVRGRGLIQGIALERPELAARAARLAFDRGLVIETAGPDGEVLKVLPPLVIDRASLVEGLEIVEESLREALAGDAPEPATRTAAA
jgi:diaminobutyrate-2-oxoglutarate transaminase